MENMTNMTTGFLNDVDIDLFLLIFDVRDFDLMLMLLDLLPEKKDVALLL